MRIDGKPAKLGAVVSSLGRAIVRGEIAPGSSLPPEHEIEAAYRVSRSVVREAMKVLAAKGLISVRPRLGTHVRPPWEWVLLDREVLGWMSDADGIDPELLAALVETRLIIEPAAAALASGRATLDDCRRIAAALAAMREGVGDPVAAIAADKAFHLAILDATHNPVLRSFRSAIDTILSAVFDLTVGAFPTNLPNHTVVAEAIYARDPDRARRAMESVLQHTADALPPKPATVKSFLGAGRPPEG
jgi:GntR family galactonate operon transcriptional repressor